MTYKPLSARDVRSQERHRSMAFGRVQSGSHVGRCISVVEFSETGCRIRDTEMACETGDVFHMMLEDVGPMVADVRWRRGAFVGISFRMRLTRPVLEHLHAVMDQPLTERMARLMAP